MPSPLASSRTCDAIALRIPFNTDLCAPITPSYMVSCGMVWINGCVILSKPNAGEKPIFQWNIIERNDANSSFGFSIFSNRFCASPRKSPSLTPWIDFSISPLYIIRELWRALLITNADNTRGKSSLNPATFLRWIRRFNALCWAIATFR